MPLFREVLRSEGALGVRPMTMSLTVASLTWADDRDEAWWVVLQQNRTPVGPTAQICPFRRKRLWKV